MLSYCCVESIQLSRIQNLNAFWRELQQPEATLEIGTGLMTAMLCYCCVESIQPSRIQNLNACGENCSSLGQPWRLPEA